MNPDSMTQVLSHARKNHVCGSATYAWAWCCVHIFRIPSMWTSNPSGADVGSHPECQATAFFGDSDK